MNDNNVENEVKDELLIAADELIPGLACAETETIDKELRGKLEEILYLVGQKIVSPSITRHCKDLQTNYKSTRDF